MASLSEVQSLNEINYKSKLKLFLTVLLVIFLFCVAFVNSYPVGDKIKAQLKAHFKNMPGCNPDFDQIRMEWLLPKIVVSDVVIPASCLGRTGEPLKFSHFTINYHLINFLPIGLPFRLDTEISGQPISLYYVVGIGQQLIRLKDQNLVLNRLQPVFGNDLKIGGTVTVDLSLLMANNVIKDLELHASSNDFQIPSQNIQGFTTPNLKVNKLFVEAKTETAPRVNVDKFIIGDVDSPLRLDLKGKVELLNGPIALSPLDLKGEITFSESFRQSLPLIDMMFQSFTQKDGFYQIRLGGTLGSPKPMPL